MILEFLMFRVILSLVLLFGAFSMAHAVEDHPILAAVKAKVMDQSKPFTMAVMIKIKSEHKAAFESAFTECIKETRKEKGCIAYDLNRSSDDATNYVNYERWSSVAALDAHLKAAHTVKLLATVAPFLDGAPEIKVYLPAGE
jgi:quinol monooxygenase YgiN